MKKKIFLACALLISSQIITKAQTNESTLVNSGLILQEGNELHDAGKYKEAIALYKKVPRSDTNYAIILHELAYSTYRDSNFLASKQYAELGLKLFPYKAVDWFNFMGNALDDLGKPEEAIAMYDSILTKNKYYYLAWYNKGLLWYKKKDFDRAKKAFQQAVLINPYYVQAHFYLGRIALEEGNVVAAMLSFVSNLALLPNNSYASSTITNLSNISDTKDEVMEKVNAKKAWTAENNFEVVQEILLSKAALDRKYKLKVDLEDHITRQIQVMLEKLSYDANDKGFWNQYYVPFYAKIIADKQLENLIFFMFADMGIKDADNYVKRNKKEIENFVQYIGNYFNGIRETHELMYANRKNIQEKFYFSKSAVTGKGKWNETPKGYVFYGPWEFYHTNGQLKSKGELDEQERKKGSWLFYYNTGVLKEKSQYTENMVDGLSESWHNNGNRYITSHYTKDVYNGLFQEYFYNDVLKFEVNAVNGKKEGIAKWYKNTGTLDHSYTYKNDKLNGDAVFYYANGNKLSTYAYTDDKLTGVYQKFSEEGKIIAKGNYINDKMDGDWNYYYNSGKLKESYKYINGELQGDYKEYYESGKLKQEATYNKGKLDGELKDYAETGKVYSTSRYEKGRLKEIAFFDEKGNELTNVKTRKGDGMFTFYNDKGCKTFEGYYNKDGLKEGTINYYYNHGKISETSNWVKGNYEGKKITYFKNGSIRETSTYKNNQEDGLYTSFYENGNKKYEGLMVAGEKQGEHVSYYENGTKKNSYYYLNNEEDGYAEFYFVNGKKDYECLYENTWLKNVVQFDTSGNELYSFDLKKGNTDFIFKHFNGKTYIKGSYKNYFLHGNYQILYFDGTPSYQTTYDLGNKNGLSKAFYFGGKTSSEGNYVNGNKDGVWKYYFENGQVMHEQTFKKGLLQGVEKLYNEDGSIDKEISYKDDYLEGDYKIYGENNELAVQLHFENGYLLGYTYLGKDGKLVPEIKLKNGTGTVTAYYKNGNKSVEFEFEDNDVNGVRKIYFSNGNPYVIGQRVLDNDQGPKQVYYLNGKVKTESTFILGNRDGLEKNYYDNGKIKSEEWYVNGELHGQSKYYDANGKLKETRYYFNGILQWVK